MRVSLDAWCKLFKRGPQSKAVQVHIVIILKLLVVRADIKILKGAQGDVVHHVSAYIFVVTSICILNRGFVAFISCGLWRARWVVAGLVHDLFGINSIYMFSSVADYFQCVRISNWVFSPSFPIQTCWEIRSFRFSLILVWVGRLKYVDSKDFFYLQCNSIKH